MYNELKAGVSCLCSRNPKTDQPACWRQNLMSVCTERLRLCCHFPLIQNDWKSELRMLATTRFISFSSPWIRSLVPSYIHSLQRDLWKNSNQPLTLPSLRTIQSLLMASFGIHLLFVLLHQFVFIPFTKWTFAIATGVDLLLVFFTWRPFSLTWFV